MKFVLFYHSFLSCWNHGNAHFLRGVVRELIALGHEVAVFEPAGSWSRMHALAEPRGAEALKEVPSLVPGAEIELYDEDLPDLDRALDGTDIVIAHEWSAPALIAALARRRRQGGRFILLFHDTHHRAVTAAEDLARFDLDGYDGVLAFGEILREIYLARGWGRSAHTWHEAADTALFRPIPAEKDTDLVFIGNWGDDERSEELREFLLAPAARAGARGRMHGVRYPKAALAELEQHGFDFGGWIPNHHVPGVYARTRATMHVPRRAYVEALPGIPTIRVFEALACGVPLISAPWSDAEGLFPEGSYVLIRSGDEAAGALSLVLRDADFARSLADTGLSAIRARHSCAHRVGELLGIVESLKGKSALHYRQPSESTLEAFAS